MASEVMDFKPVDEVKYLGLNVSAFPGTQNSTTTKQINNKLAWTANVARKLFTSGNVSIMNVYVAATVRYFACPLIVSGQITYKEVDTMINRFDRKVFNIPPQVANEMLEFLVPKLPIRNALQNQVLR